MYEALGQAFTVFVPALAPARPLQSGAPDFDQFMSEWCGATFGGGLFRVHDTVSTGTAAERIAAAFPHMIPRITANLGYDWKGCELVLDAGAPANGEPTVSILEVNLGKVLMTRKPIREFFTVEAIKNADAALSKDEFDTWAAVNRGRLPLDRGNCVGYSIPLMLGGAPTAQNQEVTDLDVYWTLTSQIVTQARAAKPGTPVKRINPQ